MVTHFRPRNPKHCGHVKTHVLGDNNVEAVICSGCGLLLDTHLSDRFRPPLHMDREEANLKVSPENN